MPQIIRINNGYFDNSYCKFVLNREIYGSLFNLNFENGQLLLNQKKKGTKMKKIIYLFLFIVTVYSAECYSQWFQVGQTVRGEYITNISVPDSNSVWISWFDLDYNSKILRTANGGQNWNFVTPPANGYFLSCSQGLDSQTAIVALGTSYSGMHLTTNAGLEWILLAEIPGNEAYFDDIVFSKSDPHFGYAVGDVSGTYPLFKTTDGGYSWTQSAIPVTGQYPIYLSGFAIDESFFGFQIYLSGTAYTSYITGNGGNNWYIGNVAQQGNGAIAFKDNKSEGISTSWGNLPVYKNTTDGGMTWNDQTINSNYDGENYPVWVSGTNTVFLNSKYEIFRSDDGGHNWIRQYHDSTDEVLHLDYARYGNKIVAYAICLNGKILKSRQSITTGINQISAEVSAEYSLLQNYPNPFNPATKIKFDILSNVKGQKSNVKLTVYDLQGKEVETLVNEILKEGSYEYEFNGNGLSSGTYFYRLEAGDFNDVKRMILLK